MEEQKLKQWYVVHAYSGYENYVMNQIKTYAEQYNMQAEIGEVIVPSEEVVEMRAGRKRESKRKFFPGIRSTCSRIGLCITLIPYRKDVFTFGALRKRSTNM